MELSIDIILPLLCLGGLVFFCWSLFSKAGKGRLLGGTIVDTANDEITTKGGLAKVALRAHVVQTKNGSKHIGLEVFQNSKLAVNLTPINLTKQEAETLIGMLREVADKT